MIRTTVEDYEPFIGAEAVARILEKARRLEGTTVQHVNATYFGGGVAELLRSLVPLMNSAGIRTEWRVLYGYPSFFETTKALHNALQGEPVGPAELRFDVYEATNALNADFHRLEEDLVIVHDPQPLPLVEHYPRQRPWVWCCHPDLTQPHRPVWDYLVRFIERYQATVVSMPEYRQPISIPQHVIPPAIDPFSDKNRRLSPAEIDRILEKYGVPRDLPIVAQVSRFDHSKDPQGVIEAADLARRETDFRLILLGNFASDDPEAREVHEQIRERADDRTRVMIDPGDPLLVNALQSSASVVLQKSLHEGFGLTVAEAMWKGTPVIGGAVGGIRLQIDDGRSGFLVASPEEAARRIVDLLCDPDLCRRMGAAGRESVRRNYLMARYLEDWLDLLIPLAGQGGPG